MSLPIVTVSPTVIVLLYADISVFPFKYRPTIPSPVAVPYLKFKSGEAAVNFATSGGDSVVSPSKYTPTP